VEEEIAHASHLSKKLRRLYQTVLTAAFSQGSGRVIIGREGELFYQPDVQACITPGFVSDRARLRPEFLREYGEGLFTRVKRALFGGPPPPPPIEGKRFEDFDPLTGIADFRDRLAARGIRLLVVPLPTKPVIYPERLWPGYPLDKGPAWPPDWHRFKRRLDAAGIAWVDSTDALWSAKARGENLFHMLDTHWSPRGMETVADAVAADLLRRGWLNDWPKRRYEALHAGPIQADWRNFDLPDMLGIDGRWLKVPASEPPPTYVLLDGRPAWADDEAEVLLLGDSYSGAFCYEPDRQNPSAAGGFVQHLSMRLGVPVQMLAHHGAGATLIRQMLRERPSMLARKRLVIWEFTTRDLFGCRIGWCPTELPPAQ
jgi:alginate O-acetyltransferase complex protein AlgJ